MATIAVIGTGTWGIALTNHLSKLGHKVKCWSAIKEEIEILSTKYVHPNLPDMIISNEVYFTTNIEDAIVNTDVVLFAVPSKFIRSTARLANQYINNKQIVVTVSKGLEDETFMTMTDIIEEELGNDFAGKTVVLSGPTHAEEVALGLPTTIVCASMNEANRVLVRDIFDSEDFAVFLSDDIKGVEYCGAFKNIIALAVGISRGIGYGDNAKAAIMTLGLNDIHRIGVAMNCKEETFMGLAGLGDLIVTCTSEHSRNNRCGFYIGQGMKADEAVNKVGMVVEGLSALPAAVHIANKLNIHTDVIEAVYKIVNENADPRIITRKLL